MYSKALSVIRKALRLDDIKSIGMRLAPETASALPQYHCIIVLQVLHHLCVAFGKVAAEDMLRTVYSKATKRLFFASETSNNSEEPFQSAMPDMGGKADEWVRSFLNAVFVAAFVQSAGTKTKDTLSSSQNNRWRRTSPSDLDE